MQHAVGCGIAMSNQATHRLHHRFGNQLCSGKPFQFLVAFHPSIDYAQVAVVTNFDPSCLQMMNVDERKRAISGYATNAFSEKAIERALVP